MRRRRFLGATIAIGAATLARAQGKNAKKHLAVLMGYAENDSEAQERFAAFRSALPATGWIEGKNLEMTIRWTGATTANAQSMARELVAMKPDAILTNTTPVTVAIHHETRTIPIVFVVVSDPVGSGLVQSLSKPGGNVTGLINLEASLTGKWLELLKEISPRMRHVAAMFNPDTAPYSDYYIEPMKGLATRVGMTSATLLVRNDDEIRRAIATLGSEPDTGLVVMTDSFMTVHRRAVIEECARHKIPATYFADVMAREGGLISYGPDVADLFRRAAPMVDRVLRGRAPAELPVEQPVKFQMTVNQGAAQAMGLKLPQSILLRADKVLQ